ncbi:hypothetical protein SAMN05443245_3456 [Paraburkholderia fungorum]|uniref:Uncharacterized protein n=1 Tax=Paraburkholderia fungorum TaxID=134537 RepID=A0A1H1H2U0_9BURK|nr:hypothetical protein [Paraburkholderia fungorum]SDR19408.1 hypothetical protein SAMN05443245_3456 [Paraburkholderia fungorum]
MRSDHTAAEFAQPQPQPVLATPLQAADEITSQEPMRLLTRVTFCFAWLFGLEAFLTGYADDAPRSTLDRHY